MYIVVVVNTNTTTTTTTTTTVDVLIVPVVAACVQLCWRISISFPDNWTPCDIVKSPCSYSIVTL